MAASMFDSTPSGFHLGGLSEREQVIGYLENMKVIGYMQVIGYLERGTAVQKFCAKLKPERKTMLVRRELMLIVCFNYFNFN